jgi:Predicted nucleotide-binding protein containing TIR-like domain
MAITWPVEATSPRSASPTEPMAEPAPVPVPVSADPAHLTLIKPRDAQDRHDSALRHRAPVHRPASVRYRVAADAGHLVALLSRRGDGHVDGMGLAARAFARGLLWWRPGAGRARRVFVVHGRDSQLRELMYDFLRALDLRPLEWESLVRATRQATPLLAEVVVKALRRGMAVMVLLTPDDVVSLHPALFGPREPSYETTPHSQPRANVLLELGMALAASPAKTIIIEIGQIKPIADLAGLNVIRFDGSETALAKIVERLKLAGCAVDDHGVDWLRPSRFAGLDAFNRKPPDGSKNAGGSKVYSV